MSRLAGIIVGLFLMIIFLTYSLGLWYGGKLIGNDQNDLRDEILSKCESDVKNYFDGLANFCDNDISGKCEIDGKSPCEITTSCYSGGEGCFTGGSVITVFMSVLMGTMACGSGAEVYATIDRIPPIDAMNDKGKKVEHLEGKIEYRNIKFRYPSRPDVMILNGMSLTVEAGKTVGLVGASSCGKSATIQLLQRFYVPEEGEVLVDGMNICDLNLQSFRRQMGFVGQEPILFSGTVKDNIRNGRLDYTDEEAIQAAKDSNAHGFITEFPEGYDTFVGEGGHSLSDGQKQRIAIARALVRNPGILLLDEATSALDSESEKVVQAAIDKLLDSSDRTSIIVAHRLSTIQNVDVIFASDRGRVQEKGTYYQ